MNADSWEAKGNKHIDMALSDTLPYHQVVAKVVSNYVTESSEVLDIGCGLGHIESELKRHCPKLQIDVADAYDTCLEKTRERGNVRNSYSINELSFNVAESIQGKYDIVVLSHVLEHLLFPAKALEDIFSLTKPEGIVVLAVPNPARPSVLLTNLFKKHYVNRGHVHSWDRSHWLNFLENIMGYEVLESHSDFIQLPASTRSSAMRFAGRALVKFAPWWSFSNISVVRRKTDSGEMYAKWKQASV